MEEDTAKVLIRIYAVLAWVGALFALSGAFVLFFGNGSYFGMAPYASSSMGGWYVFIGILLILIAVFDGVVGWGLWTCKPWARFAAIIVSVLNLLDFPIGTIIGVIGVWLFGFEPAIKRVFYLPERRVMANIVAGKRGPLDTHKPRE